MTFSGRIRLYLIAVALIPSLLIMAVIYFYSQKQAGLSNQKRAFDSLRKYDAFESVFQQDIESRIDELVKSPELKRALVNVRSGRIGPLETNPRIYDLDFMEIVDSTNNVLATFHRPGLLGQKLDLPQPRRTQDNAWTQTTVEYDRDGAHAAFAHRVPLNSEIALYTGAYIDDQFVSQLRLLLDVDVHVYMPTDSLPSLATMQQGSVYDIDDKYQMILAGGESSGFYLAVSFPREAEEPFLTTIFSVAAFVAIISAILAIGLGFYITGKAKREIDNLVSATSRVAAGDFSTPVMAYDEGEFSQLADSVSDMMHNLRQTQSRLATTEKIAAWQAVGRKIAHEIKNPLTPIAISVDDLRRSHAEKLPQFDSILDETTRTIKTEIERLIKLLDEFVRFARMKAPEISSTDISQFIHGLQTLYRNEIESGRISISNNSRRSTINIDPEAFKQVLINLIKNGLEASEDSTVSVNFAGKDQSIEITVEDTGPGFSENKLSNSFEPYVTTKEGGSGLGLVICHRIVNDHGGTMELYNHSDGAGVRINLPQ